MPKPRKPLSLTSVIRAELAAVPSVNAVAKALDLSQPTLARFLRGDTDSIDFGTASRLLDYFDYTLVKRTAASQPAAKPNTTKPSTTKPKPTKRPAAKR